MNQSQEISGINLFNQQKTPKQNDQKTNKIVKGLRIDINRFNSNLNETNQINQITLTTGNQDNNTRKEIVMSPVLGCVQNNQQHSG